MVKRLQRAIQESVYSRQEDQGVTRCGNNESLEGTRGHPSSTVEAERAKERNEWCQGMAAFSCVCSFAGCWSFQRFKGHFWFMHFKGRTGCRQEGAFLFSLVQQKLCWNVAASRAVATPRNGTSAPSITCSDAVGCGLSGQEQALCNKREIRTLCLQSPSLTLEFKSLVHTGDLGKQCLLTRGPTACVLE